MVPSGSMPSGLAINAIPSAMLLKQMTFSRLRRRKPHSVTMNAPPRSPDLLPQPAPKDHLNRFPNLPSSKLRIQMLKKSRRSSFQRKQRDLHSRMRIVQLYLTSVPRTAPSYHLGRITEILIVSPILAFRYPFYYLLPRQVRSLLVWDHAIRVERRAPPVRHSGERAVLIGCTLKGFAP